MLLISVIEDEGFRELMLFLYVMPLRAAVTKHIEKYFKEKKGELKVK